MLNLPHVPAAQSNSLRGMIAKPLNLVFTVVAGCAALILVQLQPAAAQPAMAKPPSSKSSPTVPKLPANAWPVAPTSERYLTVPRSPHLSKKPIMQIEAPIPEPPPNDLMKKVASDGPVRGTLVYAPYVFAEPASEHYFVLRGVGLTRFVGQQATSVASYHVETAIYLFDPKFSSDGTRILFKGGWPFESYGRYQLFMWDIKAQQLLMVGDAESISYNDVFWSPDDNYIAYIRGGNTAGKAERGTSQIQLRILDLRTGKSRRVAKNPGVTRMAWTQQGTLLFTMLPKNPGAKEEDDDPRDAAEGEEPGTPSQPSIYEAPIKGGKARLIIENGFDPVPSPDGKWIAFNSLTAPANGAINPNAPPDLHLFNRARQERILLDSIGKAFVGWTPDGKSLVTIETVYGAGEVQGEAHIKLTDPATLRTRQVATLSARDFKVIGRTVGSDQFKAIKFSRDGRFLFVNISEVTGESHPFLTTRETLQAIDLSSGGVFTVAQLEDPYARVLGWDWHDESGTSSSVSTSSTSSKRNGGR